MAMVPRSHWLKMAAVVVLASLGSAGTGTALAASPASSSVKVVASNWKFTPAKVVAYVGKPTTLELSSSLGVHGIASDDLGIPNTTIVPGKTLAVTFTPKKAGTYALHCSVFCGPGHANMMLTVVVKP